MTSRPRSRRTGRWAVASLAVLSVGLASAVPGGLAQASDVQRPSKPRVDRAKPRPDQKVTLITGDQVTLRGGDPAKLSIQPGPGRRNIPIRTYQSKGRLTVIPADVQSQLGSGRLDRRLFDVTGLIEAGQDDKTSPAIPLIVTYPARTKRAATVPAATVTRQLPVVNGTAVKVAKKDAGSFLRQVALNRSAGVGTIWLDGKRRPVLDQSVPQIGAPAAWQAGYTGRDVPVAVLDTGIDNAHPNLADRVAGAKNFTPTPAGDLVGHGTHIASTIAGTAAASSGQYKGVAPGVKLYDGKVCEWESCFESAILAGMEWAATEVKAKVVNVSLGAADTPRLDPLEEAVNRLTAQTGTLFVVSAGNDGPAAGSVLSPGSADAALTVGAVDKQDQLADFSSRGPRVGDGAVKPDVTAPGVDIVAARAKEAYIGTPVGDQYLKLSGTSMATPHAVGAAALLAQQHPDWKAADLKAAVMSSAKPLPSQSVLEQGAGRIDVARAVKQTTLAEPGSINFGLALWPHHDDEPVTRKLTYRNVGTEPITLNLTANLAAADGQAAPAGAIKLSAPTVTVPAGGTSSVDVISDTRHDGPDVRYSGRVTATSGDTAISTPLVVEKEQGEKYTLTIQHIGLDGKPFTGAGAGTYLDGIDSFREGEVVWDPSGTASIRLPKGEYMLNGSQVVPRPGTEILDGYDFLQPSLQLTADTKVVMDARTTKPVKVTVPQPDAVAATPIIGHTRATRFGDPLNSASYVQSFDRVRTVHLGPKLPADQLMSYITSQWAKPNGDSFDDSPYLYGLLNTFPGVYPTGFTREVKADELATVDQKLHATSDRGAEVSVSGWTAALRQVPIPVATLRYRLPAERKLYLDASPVTWFTSFAEMPNYPFGDPITTLQGKSAVYRAGRTYQDRFNAAVLAPAPERAYRDQGVLSFSLPATSDADGHLGETLTDTATGRLYRNGEPIGSEWPRFGRLAVGDLPAEKAEYKYVTSLTRPQYSKLSSRIDYAWTFSSAATSQETTIPMLGIRYRPKVDSRNTADRTTLTTLPVEVVAQPGTQLPGIARAELEISGDSGQTWHTADLVPTGPGRFKAVFSTPAGPAVSLKAKLVDALGHTTEQTVIDAYLLK